jgi:predicted metalloprotease with PDZ domain
MKTTIIKAATAAVALAAAMFPAALLAADLTVHVDARDIARKRVHTEETLAVKGGATTLVLAKWIPGEHMPSGPIDTLVGMVIKANGTPLTWKRDPINTFAVSVNVPAGVSRLDISLDSGLPTEGGSFSAGPTSSEQLAVISWNHFVLFPKGRDAATISTEATLMTPAGWKVVSSLATHPVADGAVGFEPVSLSQLIDSPVQIGRFGRVVELNGSAPYPELKHAISLMADSEAALNVSNTFQADYSRLVAEAGALFGTRMYRHYTWLLTLSDHVAHFGLEHHESSDDRVDEDSVSEPAFKDEVAGLLAHEYVHSWNGKFRRPAGLLSPDYQTPMDDSLLWVYEGMTEFWGQLLPVRAGITTPETYRDELASVVAYYQIQSGARWRPLADTAVAAQDLYNAPSAWSSSRRSVDFYEASMLLWLNVDSELRARSGGKASIDDFVHVFYAGPGGAPQLKPYHEEDVYTALNSVVPADWRAIIRHHLDSLGPDALNAGLESSGWKLTYSAEKNAWIEMREKAYKGTNREDSIGFSLDKDGMVVDASELRAAAQAGVGPGMRLVAVNGRKFAPEVLDAAMIAAKDSRKPIELLIESGDYFRVISVPYFDGPRFPHLVRLADKPDTLSEVLKHRT